MIKLLFAAVLAFLLSACAGPSISPDQLATVTKENNASVGCATGTGPWGRANVVFVNAQNANITSGRVAVNTDCSVTVEAAGQLPAAPAPAK